MYTRRQLERIAAADGEGRERITKRELVKLWVTIEYHQAEVAKRLAIFNAWCSHSPDLARDWGKFTDAGGIGISIEDLKRFFDGKVIRRRRMRRKKHLRLYVVNERR